MNIAIFCEQASFSRLISTIIVRLNQTGTSFKIVPDGEPVIDFGVVDADNLADRTRALATTLAQPQLQLVNIVAASNPAIFANEVLRSNVVVGLMPLIKKLADAKVAALNTQTLASANITAGKRVLRALAVDDSLTVRSQLRNVITRIGMQCDLADSAAVALTMMEANTYDIMFADVVMPVMNGYELTRAVKKDRDRKNMPVIILTSQSSPFDRARGALAGCDTYLVKPVDEKRVFDATVKAISKAYGHELHNILLNNPALHHDGQPGKERSGARPLAFEGT